jgi:hypothetical protein
VAKLTGLHLAVSQFSQAKAQAQSKAQAKANLLQITVQANMLVLECFTYL